MKKYLIILLLATSCTQKRAPINTLVAPTTFLQDTLYDKDGNPLYVKYKPPVPVVYTNIDNVDTKLVYSPAWAHNGTTTATGFYGGTMAYDATAGRTVMLTFTGTSVEVFAEKKVGHGSVKFQVDNLPDSTKNLGVAGPIGSTSVYNHRGLTLGTHTIKVTIVGTGNVVFDYIRIDGTAQPPPVSEYIFLMPGAGAKTIIESASSGTKFKLGDGLYTTTTINVPIGVSIYPPDNGVAYFEATHAPPVDAATRDVAIFQLKSGSRVNGAQTISGFTVRGKNTATGGIIVDNRDNVVIDKVIVNECNFSGIWLRNTTKSVVSNSESFNSSWASTGWVSGELNIFNIDQVEIHHSKFWNNKTGTNGWSSKGYGIKALYQGGTYNCKIYDVTIDLPPQSLWNSGQSPNISIEFNDAIPNGIEIYNCKLINGISMACHRPTKGGRIWIHDNDMARLTSNSTFAVEVVASNMTIGPGNKIAGSAMFTANYNPGGTNNGHWTDIVVDNNDFTSNGSNPSWGATFLLGAGGMDMNIKNNRLNTGSYTRVKHTGPTSNSLIIQTGNTPSP